MQPVPASDTQRQDGLHGRPVVDRQPAVGEVNAQRDPLVRGVGVGAAWLPALLLYCAGRGPTPQNSTPGLVRPRRARLVERADRPWSCGQRAVTPALAFGPWLRGLAVADRLALAMNPAADQQEHRQH